MKKKALYNLGKKSFLKSKIKPFLKSNRIVLAAIAGAAAGVLITRLIGSDKAREVLASVEGNIKDFSHKLMDGGKETALKMQKVS